MSARNQKLLNSKELDTILSLWLFHLKKLWTPKNLLLRRVLAGTFCELKGKNTFPSLREGDKWNPMIWSVGNPFSIMHESKYTNGWSKIFCWKIWRNLQHSIVCLQSGIDCISGSKGFVQMCCSFHLFLLWSQNYVAKVFVSAKQFYLNWLFWLLTSGQFCNSCELFCQRLVMTGRLGFSR